MKDYVNIGEADGVLRLVFGVMLFLLVWFDMLGRISLGESVILRALILVGSVSLLLTGSSRISPLYHLLRINTNKRIKF